jgi:NACHT domain
LSLPRVPYASYDSGRKDLPSSCLEGTRVGILNDIGAWLERTEPNTPPVYWLNGLAGIGKSTVAQTVSDRAEKKGILGASFFFSRSDNLLRDPQLVLPTLAFQLAHSDNAFKDVIVEAIQQNADLGHKALLTQIQRLIVMPLLKIDPNRNTLLIVLDALDECEEKGTAELLKLLFSHAIQIPFLRILITSRPEPHISSVFDDASNYAQRILHDIEASVIEQDIRLYIMSELAKIPQKLGLRMTTGWISEDEIDSLVAKSGKLFVYAATTVRFIGDDRLRDPRRHLNLILNTQAAQQIGATPYTQLDNLYMGVLRNTLSDSNRRDVLDRFQLVVGSIVLLRQPLPLHSLAHFVGFQIDTVDATLSHLRSVIIPPSNIHDAPRIYHHSFLDFITDSRRCVDPDFLIVSIPDQERRHTIRCFELMAMFLKRDVAGISHPWILNSKVDGLERKVNDALPPEVQYACRFWASHLSRVEFGDRRVVEALEGFSRRSILWWLEAMSLIGSSFTAAGCMQDARHWAVCVFYCGSLDDILIGYSMIGEVAVQECSSNDVVGCGSLYSRSCPSYQRKPIACVLLCFGFHST